MGPDPASDRHGLSNSRSNSKKRHFRKRNVRICFPDNSLRDLRAAIARDCVGLRRSYLVATCNHPRRFLGQNFRDLARTVWAQRPSPSGRSGRSSAHLKWQHFPHNSLRDLRSPIARDCPGLGLSSLVATCNHPRTLLGQNFRTLARTASAQRPSASGRPGRRSRFEAFKMTTFWAKYQSPTNFGRTLLGTARGYRAHL